MLAVVGDQHGLVSVRGPWDGSHVGLTVTADTNMGEARIIVGGIGTNP
jgi:hypothetical protein